MAEWIEQLERLTETAAANIREMTHEELLHFVEERGRLIDQARRAERESGAAGTAGAELSHSQHESTDLQRRVHKLLAHDAAIRARMEELLREHEGSFGKVRQAKRQKTAYDMEYTPDSLFFDKKK